MGRVTFKILCCYGICMAGGRQEEGEKGKDRDMTKERGTWMVYSKSRKADQIPLTV